MDDLTPDQARALWEAGGFMVLSGLPEGSEFGIDGTFHLVRRFSGIKFVPPGLHLITWSPPTGPSNSAEGAGPSSIPIRSAFVRYFQPRQRVVLQYDPKSETVSPAGSLGADATTVISDDHLRSLDGELAAYPFQGLERWNSLTCLIDHKLVEAVLVDGGRVDGLTPALGEENEVREDIASTYRVQTEEKPMEFVRFQLRRSWRDGAVGEEVTRYSKDKSWLLGHVVKEQLGGDPLKLVAQIQLAFVLLLYLSSYSALLVYKRLLSLLAQSSSLLLTPTEYGVTQNKAMGTYIALTKALEAQISSISDGTFDTELPELDIFFLDSLESLRHNLAGELFSSDIHWDQGDIATIRKAWTALSNTAKRRWGWDIGELVRAIEDNDDSDEDEEGEYAPVVVEL